MCGRCHLLSDAYGYGPGEITLQEAAKPLKALILGAGQGKRLLPLTEDEPKALLNIGAKRLVEWQIHALAGCGVREVVFISGFRLDAVEVALAQTAKTYPDIDIRILHNPFYALADNIASCWVARSEMTEDFILVNGDTLFRAPLLRQVLESPEAPISLAVDHKDHYDDDDMKVSLKGGRLLDVGKTLPAETVSGESIGLFYFRGEGPALFAEALDQALRAPESLKRWYLTIIAELAGCTTIQGVTISGHDWCEIDYPLDLQRARQMVAAWQPALDRTASSGENS